MKINTMSEIIFNHRRIAKTGKSTLSTLETGGKVLFFLLEDLPAFDQNQDGTPDKIKGSTAIEAGEGWLVPWFMGKFYEKAKTNKQDFALALQMVKGVDRWGKVITHGNIRVHTGLDIIHTDGCPLTGAKPYINKAGNFAFMSGSSGAAFNGILYPMLRKLWEPGMKDFKVPVKWVIDEHF